MSQHCLLRGALGLGVGIMIVFALFDVSFDPQFSLPAESQRLEPDQEQRFFDCFERRDHAIHERAFSMIDNPDVQREFIASEREVASKACRGQFPERMQSVRTPLRIKLIGLRFRYGN